MTLLRALLYWLACFLVAVYLSLLLAGCSSAPYWKQVREPYTLLGVLHVPQDKLSSLCNNLTWRGRGVNGCVLLNTENKFGVVFIADNLSPAHRACIESHDKRHVAGDDHSGEDGPDVFALDCGDGTMWLPPLGGI